ncbi:MAG TPA: ATP-binding protein, partial [Spirochaetia bacterium]|nr:ATP-binding protein [Spirochaetia bacterium]
MKLFTKTLLFFIGVILFQCVLSMALVTNATRRANLADARKELEDEASILYDGFNSWKRQMWMSLISITRDRALWHPPVGDRQRPLRETLLESKMDALVLRQPGGPGPVLVQGPPGAFDLADVEGLRSVNPYPYIELASVRGILCIVGVTAADFGGSHVELFLLKRIDPEFCTQLTLNRKSQVAFLRGAQVLAASFASPLPPSFFDPREMQSSYRELYDRRMGRAAFNAAFQRIGRLDHRQEAGDELFLGTIISNEPYEQKLLLLDRAILAVSLAGALLTVALSLFLSRNITRPIADLLGGMERLRGGAWETRVRSRGGYEISRLSRSFNHMARELAEHRAAIQQALHETVLLKEYNEKIVNSIRAGIAIVNRDLVVEKVNRSFSELFALPEERVVGVPLTYLDIDIVDEQIAEKILSVFRREREFHSEITRSPRGRVYEIRLYPFSSPEGELPQASRCVFMVDDISVKTELEEKIFQAEKLATISMLSAGMAHEINNPLGSILTNVQNLIDDEASAERRVSLRWIEQETRRIARIVQELLNFSSGDSRHAPGSDVNDVVREVVGLLSHSLAREGRIRIDTRLAPGLPPSVVSNDELKQVVINLLKNSVQAIGGEGRILLSSRMGAAPGSISLSIADTGCGIPKEVIPRIFDPFFTTKANGAGTGLGLSVVYGIVTKYSGSIDVKSRD